MCINLRLIGLTAMVCLFGLGGIGRAELQPSEIFLVYNRNLPASRELAEYYMKKRGVPAAQSIGLDLPLPDKTDNIEREAYLTKVRVPLRGWLRHENLQDKIRCLVTVYGVPLRIAGTGVTKEDKPLLKEVNAELDTAMAAMEGLIAALEKFAPQPAPASSPAVARFDPAKRLAHYEALRQGGRAGRGGQESPGGRRADQGTGRVAPARKRAGGDRLASGGR